MLFGHFFHIPQLAEQIFKFVFRKVVVDHNHTVWPNGIALDFEARHLYYVDAYLGVISRVDYSGSNPKQIASGHLQHPFGFDLLGKTAVLGKPDRIY